MVNKPFGSVVSLSLIIFCGLSGPLPRATATSCGFSGITGSAVVQARQQPQPSTRNRLITWLRNLAGIRQTLVAIYPDGKIVAGASMEFRWNLNRRTNPDHFKIRIVENISATSESEVWASEDISGTVRSFTAMPNLNLNSRYAWKLEMYDANSPSFSVQIEQPFSFLSESDLIGIRQREATVQGWIRERPEDKHLLLLLATFYANVGMNYRARDLFIELLQASQIAVDSSAPSYKELATILSRHLESVQTKRDLAQRAYHRSNQSSERRRLLNQLLGYNLTLLEYREATANLNALLQMTHDEGQRMTLERRRQSLAQEESFAQQLFVADAKQNETRDSQANLQNKRPARSAPVLNRSGWILRSHARTNTGANKVKSSAFTLTLDPYKAAWYLADNEILGKYPKPGGRTVQPTYFAGEEPVTLIEGLRQGDILLKVSGLGREMLRRSILNFVVKLAAFKQAYMSSSERTATLDESWSVIPQERVMAEDFKAFARFARIIYPDQKDIGIPEIMSRRDQLVRYLEKHWELPAGDFNDDKFLEQKLFHDILLYRMSPVLVLRRTRGTMPPVDTIEIINEGFASIAGSVIAGPPQQGAEVSISLNGACPGTLSKKIDAVRPSAAKALIIRLDSKQKGSYLLRFRLKNHGRTIWESSRVGLYFI